MRLSLMVVLAAALAVPLDARADDCAETSSHTLRGHTFMYPATIDSAFVETYFGTRTTGRFETVKNFPVGNFRTDIDSVGLSEALDFELALGERFAVGLGVFGRALLGINGRALATTGAYYSYGATIDGAFRIARIEETGTQFSLRGELFGVQGGGQISLLPFIAAVKNNPAADLPSVVTNLGELLVTPVSQYGGALSINVAQALSSVFSLQGSFRLNLHRFTRSPFIVGTGRVDVETNAWIPQGGIAVGMNPIDWPVAFSAEYRISAQTTNDTSAPGQHMITAGAYYSARQDLQVGPVAAAELSVPERLGIDVNGNPKGSDRGKAFYGQLMMRYIW